MLSRVRQTGDEGFSLIETTVAMILFAVLAASIGGVVQNTLGMSRSNAARVAAANLAQQQIEAARSSRGVDLLNATTTVDPKPEVNGVTYDVTQTVQPVAADSSVSLCTGAPASSNVRLAYKLVTVTVTWPGMGSARPVREDTLLHLGIGRDGMDPAKGTAAVGVTGGDGQPRSGVVVTLAPGGATFTTGSDGCAVFSDLSPSVAYTAAVEQSGHVAKAGTKRLLSSPFSVTASGVTRVPLSYDRTGTLTAGFSAPGSYPAPAALGVTVSAPDQLLRQCASSDPYGCVTGSPRTAGALYPATYSVWAGLCSDGRSTAPVSATVTSGGTTHVTLPLAAVQVQVQSSTGAPLTGRSVVAQHAADGTCSAETWPMTPSGAAIQTLALPAGTWTFSVPGGTPAGGTWPSATLVAGQTTSVVVRP